MIAQPTRAKPAERSQPGRHDDRARAPEKSGSRGTQFDAHYWLEHYRATHTSADSSDLLAGVPFN